MDCAYVAYVSRNLPEVRLCARLCAWLKTSTILVGELQEQGRSVMFVGINDRIAL